MASEGVNTAILVIAGIIMASMLSTALISQIGIINNVVRMSSREARDRIATSIDIIYVALNTSNSNRHIVVFVKNIGSRDISIDEVIKIDIYVYDTDKLQLYTYSQIAYPNHWNFTEIQIDGVWRVGETLIIRIYNATDFSIPFNIRIVLPNGVQNEYIYSG